jgi:hypothetical protein
VGREMGRGEADSSMMRRGMSTCLVFALSCGSSRVPTALRGYDILVESNDQQSRELARAMRGYGFHVREKVRGGAGRRRPSSISSSAIPARDNRPGCMSVWPTPAPAPSSAPGRYNSTRKSPRHGPARRPQSGRSWPLDLPPHYGEISPCSLSTHLLRVLTANQFKELRRFSHHGNSNQDDPEVQSPPVG